MKLLVTGALGHIGSYIIRDLAHKFPGADIIMIDNMMTQRFSSLFNLPATARYRFIEADVTVTDLRPILEEADVVIHLAAITDAAGSFDKASQVEANNYQATLKVAQGCVDAGVRLISISSTSVYGTQNKVVSEECLPGDLKPQSPYAATKLKEEKLIMQLCSQEGLKGIVCRFGTIFGTSPGMRFHTAVNKFCWQAVMRQPITVWSTAYDQKRPYLDLLDVGNALSFIIKKDLFDGCIYNVLTQNSTVHQIIDVIREFIPDLEMVFVDNPIMNQLSYEVSCERFINKGFNFMGNLKHGVSQTLALLRQSNGFLSK